MIDDDKSRFQNETWDKNENKKWDKRFEMQDAKKISRRKKIKWNVRRWDKIKIPGIYGNPGFH